MKCILKFIGSFLLLFPILAYSQAKPADTKTPAAKPKDSIAKPGYLQRYGLRVGIDAYSLARTAFDKNFKGLEAVADYRLNQKIYAAGEIGATEYTSDDAQLNSTSKGSYIKIGFDYNAYENWLDMENLIYFGVRYGFSSFSETLNSYKIYQNTDLDGAGNYLDEVTVYPNEKYSGLSAHWIEVVGGVKAEVFTNVFIGFSVRLKTLISQKQPSGFENLYIPGFNRTYDGNFGAGFNYTVSYFIPLYKKKAEKAKPKVKAKAQQ